MWEREGSNVGVRGLPLVGITIVLAMLLLAFAPRADAGSATLTARGSAEQVQVTGATPGAKVKLIRDGSTVASKPGGELGGVVFRKVTPGSGYTVRSAGTTTPSLKVLSTRSKPPSKAIYDQTLDEGYGYLTTRDGTKLAIDVRLPGPPEDGPYPTLVEYSGYGYANPAGPQSGIQPVASLLGYAVVDVNMRGTGCSGGAFDYFEPLQSLDGYDIVETVARQPWVMHGKVGMLGVSYGGISQLFVAATQPPHLSAITPLSVIDNTQTTLYPGGILNTGFALEWAQDRVDDSQPAGPDSGQAWAWQRIEEGDDVCADNQELHPEATNLLKKTNRNRYYRPAVADPLSPVKFVDKIDVPVFMACQWTDEQTGGHCPTLVRAMTGTKQEVVHVHQRRPHRFARSGDVQPLVRLHADLRRQAEAGAQPRREGAGAGSLSADHRGQRSHAARRPDPGRARFRIREGGLRGPAGRPHPLRQRRRRRSLQARARLRAVVRDVPAAEHGAGVLVPVRQRQARRQAGRRGRPVHLGSGRPPADRLLGQHRGRHERPLDRQPELRLDAEPGGDGAFVPEPAARLRHRRPRRRRGPGLGPLEGEERRSAGDGHRGPSRRSRDLRPGRLAADRRAEDGSAISAR